MSSTGSDAEPRVKRSRVEVLEGLLAKAENTKLSLRAEGKVSAPLEQDINAWKEELKNEKEELKQLEEKKEKKKAKEVADRNLKEARERLDTVSAAIPKNDVAITRATNEYNIALQTVQSLIGPVAPPPPPVINDSFLIQLVANPKFVQNKLRTDEDAHTKCLGPLNDPNYSWPILGTAGGQGIRIDMRLMDLSELRQQQQQPPSSSSGHTNARVLRPAAREILKHADGMALQDFSLTAFPGAGKTGAIFDVARERFLVYCQTSEPEGNSQMSRKSREMDKMYVALYVTLVKALGHNISSDVARNSNYDIAKRICKANLCARLLGLVRLVQDRKEQITPFEFLVHQLAGKHELEMDAFEALQNRTDEELNKVTYWIADKLECLGIRERCMFVAFDEIELAAMHFPGYFHSDPISTTHSNKNILYPLSKAADEMARALEWSSIFSGTASAKQTIETLKSDLGKPTLTSIANPKIFPLVTVSDVRAILGRLKLDDKVKKSLDMLESDVSLLGPAPTTLCEWLNSYAVGARFRVLTAAIEHVIKVYDMESMPGDILLLNALESSVSLHKEGLLRLIKMRLNSKDANAIPDAPSRSNILRTLHAIYVSAYLTNGQAKYSSTDPLTAVDLTVIGIASSLGGLILDDDKKGLVSTTVPEYGVSERFVLDVIETLFADTDLSIADISMDSTVNMLRSLFVAFSQAAPVKGNFIEHIILQRLVQWSESKRYAMVADLPIFDGQLDNTEWAKIPFTATRVQRMEGAECNNFLASSNAVGVVVSPGNACRPDGILMLSTSTKPYRALTIGVAVYSNYVPKSKIYNQFNSMDMSRCWLNEKGYVYAATKSFREEWLNQGLHETIAIRVSVILPRSGKGVKPPSQQLYKREMSAEGGVAQPVGSTDDGERDVVFNITRDNIELLFGKPDEMLYGNVEVKTLYALLRIATGDVDFGQEKVAPSNIVAPSKKRAITTTSSSSSSRWCGLLGTRGKGNGGEKT